MPLPLRYQNDGETHEYAQTHDLYEQDLCKCLTDEDCQCLMWATRNGTQLLTICKGRGVCRDDDRRCNEREERDRLETWLDAWMTTSAAGGSRPIRRRS